MGLADDKTRKERALDENVQWGRRWLELSAQAIADNREYLIELDRQIGDGDHGENLDRGYSAVVRGDGFQAAETGSELMKYVAKTLLSNVGGAAGPLYGTAYLRAAGQIPDHQLTGQDIAQMLSAAVGGVQARGKAQAGDKTMVDTWLAAVDAAAVASATGDVLATLEAAAAAAQEGAEATKPMRASKGRASYLGERSRGHLDPGAVSSALLLEAAAEAGREVFGGGGQ